MRRWESNDGIGQIVARGVRECCADDGRQRKRCRMNPTYELIRDELERSRNALIREALLIHDDAFDTRPSEDMWSAGEILDHLKWTEERVTGLIVKVSAATTRDADARGPRSVPAPHDLLQSVDSLFATKAAGRIVSPHTPARTAERADAIASLRDSRVRLLRAIDRMQDVDLTGVVYPHPALGDLDMYQWLLFVARHEDRHRAQLERIRTQLVTL